MEIERQSAGLIDDEIVNPEDAEAVVFDASEELKKQKKIASDTTKTLQERLDAFEDIFESEVGDTNLVRARNIEREAGLSQIYLKFEGANPTGTQKDRIAFAQALDALRRGYDTITVATCGNYGVAVAFAASMAGLKTHIYIPEGYHTKRTKEMQELGARIEYLPGTYEDVVSAVKKIAQEKDWYDANPGGANTSTQLRAYGQIAYEIYDDLRDAPAIVAVAVSNGTTLAGIYRGFVSLYRRGKTSRIPKMIAASSFKKNPIIQALVSGTDYQDLSPKVIKETAVNEPLINWHSFDGALCLSSVRKSNGMGFYVTDKAMLAHSRTLLNKEGLNVLAASTAGLIGLLEFDKLKSLGNDRFVAVLTGRKE